MSFYLIPQYSIAASLLVLYGGMMIIQCKMNHFASIFLSVLPLGTCVLGGEFAKTCPLISLLTDSATIKAYCSVSAGWLGGPSTLDLDKCVGNVDGKLVVSKQPLVEVYYANVHSVPTSLFPMLHSHCHVLKYEC